MIDVSLDLIRSDVITKFNNYVNAFPELIAFFSEVKKKQNCDACFEKLCVELSKEKELTQKFKKIYGNDIKIDIDLITYKNRLTPTIATAITNVFFILKDDYKAFIDDFFKNKIIRTIDTTYIPEDREIMVTVVYNIILRNKN